MDTPKFGALTSSVDNNAFSLTATGVIGIVATLIVQLVAHFFHQNLPYDAVVTLVTAGVQTIAAIATIVGLLRKPVVALSKS
jgi:uncharacterized membrane protein YphA (DoxX/SURF4 family)